MQINRNSVLYNASVMTVAGLLLQVIGFVYRIYLSRMAGPEGLGIYRLILPVHSVSISFAISGVRMAATSLSAEMNLKRDKAAIRMLTRICISIFLGIFVCMVIPVGIWKNQIAVNILGDPRTEPALLIMMACILLTGFELILESIFLGVKKTKFTAVSNVLEQLTQMGAVIWLLSSLRTQDSGLTATLICVAMVISEIPVVTWLGISYSRVVAAAGQEHPNPPPGKKQILARVRNIALPVTLSGVTTTLLSSAGTVLLPQRLMVAGLSDKEAIGQLGIISGMALPLLTFPSLFINALSTVLVPTISHSIACGNQSDTKRKIRKAIQAVSLIGLPAMATLLPLASDLSLLLYDQVLSSKYLALLAVSVIFLYYQNITISILNGLELQKQAMINVITGEGVELCLIYLLAALPQLHIYGYILGTLSCGILITFFNLRLIRKRTGVKLGIGKILLLPLMASVILGLFSRAIYHSLSGNVTQGLALIATILLCMTVYFILLLIMGIRPIRYFKGVLVKKGTGIPCGETHKIP